MGHVSGVGGVPEIRDRPEPFDVDVREIEIPASLGTIVDLAPVSGLSSVWLLLGEDGSISLLNMDTGEAGPAATSTVPPEPDHKPWKGHELARRLHASNDGRFASVVHDYGRNGQVIDLATGRVTIPLSGGDYHAETVPFSFAFVKVVGRVAALHRTDWNRLDLTDAATGELLSARGPTSYSQGEDRPEHYLDYFQGALHVNPSGTRVAVDGWVWHPVGVVTAWSLAAWAKNVWESEDGPTKRDICYRGYYWDHAMTWLDEDRLAIGGIGDDDEWMIDGARIFDVTQVVKAGGMWTGEVAREVMTFAGPGRVFLSDGASLFTSDDVGLSRWDPNDGFRTGQFSGFSPTHRHAGSGELAQLLGGRLLRWGRVSKSYDADSLGFLHEERD